VLESSVQQASEEGLEVVGLIRMDVVPVIRTLEKVATGMLGCGDGISKEEVLKPLCSQQKSTRSDEHVLRLGIWTASATTSPAKL
jgi:hypothetical protein